MNKYIHVIDENGRRITSVIVVSDENTCIKQVKIDYPGAAEYLSGDDNMLGAFLSGKIYKDGQFIDNPLTERTPTRAEMVGKIKKEYEPRFQRLKDAILQRALIGASYTDIQDQYKKLTAEMAMKIKEGK